MKEISKKIINSINGNGLIYSSTSILSSAINKSELNEIIKKKFNFKNTKIEGLSDHEIYQIVDFAKCIKGFLKEFTINYNTDAVEYIEYNKEHDCYLIALNTIIPKSFFVITPGVYDRFTRVQKIEGSN